MLEGLIVARIAQASVHGLHRLPLAVAEEPVDVLSGGLSLRPPTEARAELIEELAESSQQRARGAGRHACSVPNIAYEYKSIRSAQAR
jgi:hypothetical protein